MKIILLFLIMSFSSYAQLSIKPNQDLIPERRLPTPTCINGVVDYTSAIDFIMDFCESEQGIHSLAECRKYADDVGPGIFAKELHIFIVKKSRKFCGDKRWK